LHGLHITELLDNLVIIPIAKAIKVKTAAMERRSIDKLLNEY